MPVWNSIIKTMLFIFFVININTSFAQPNWHNWLRQLKHQAISEGINPHLFDSLFATMTPNPKVLNFDRRQPETRITYYKYQRTRGDLLRIKLGRREYKKHHTLLQKVGHYFGVDPCIIVTIWGLETSYGRFLGDFDVIRSLATLAHDGRRSEFFRKELLLALHMVNEGVISAVDFKGEWAGASGQSQFLPSNWYKYAVDFDHNNKKDIWHSYPDIFASIANYLRTNGWQFKQPILAEVNIPDHFDQNLIGLKITKPVAAWQRLGVTFKNGIQIILSAPASILHPHGGPYLMAFNNFKALLQWNYSSYYAGTIDYVAQQICEV